VNAPTQLERRAFVGGSDIGAIIGVSKWRTPLDVYLEKRGERPITGLDADPKREKILRRGKRFEPVVLEMLAEERGIEITARNQRYVDSEHPFMACEIDAEATIDGETVNIEIKTSHPFAASQWGEEGTDEIDVSYAAQAMWGLMLTGRRRTVFGVLIGSDNLLTYEIAREEETILAMRDKAVRFWNDHVLAGVPPEPVNLPDVMHLFNRKTETRIAATEEIAGLVAQLVAASNDKARAEQGIEELKFQIGTYMLGAEQMEAPNKAGRHILTYKGKDLLTVGLQSQQRLDQKLLRELHPAIAAECTKEASFFTYRPKRGKQ
jgi:putative phage-type endonuclease